jgi:hypothetical protein
MDMDMARLTFKGDARYRKLSGRFPELHGFLIAEF